MRVDACLLRVMQDPCAVSAKGVLCRVFNGVGREPCMGVPVGCNLTRRKDPQRTTAKVQHPILVGQRILQVPLPLLTFSFPANIACKKLWLRMVVEGRRHVADGRVLTFKLYLADEGKVWSFPVCCDTYCRQLSRFLRPVVSETLQNGLDNKIYMAEHASKAKTQDAGRYR